VPYVFVGDEAFGLSQRMMRPHAGKSLTLKKGVFNCRLCRARRFIECSFGILTIKWRIFHRPLNVSEELLQVLLRLVAYCTTLYESEMALILKIP
jgi:hypothetical protein